MEIRENNEICIYAPISNVLDEYESNRLFDNIKKDSRKIAIDLTYVNECSINFIEKLKKMSSNKKIGLFNIPAEIFILFNTMNIDKNVLLYTSELDFLEETRRLINRNFSVVS